MAKQPDPWAALDALMAVTVEPTGPEWFTAEQFADRYHISLSHAERRLRGLWKAGKVERWEGKKVATGRHGYKFRAKDAA